MKKWLGILLALALVPVALWGFQSKTKKRVVKKQIVKPIIKPQTFAEKPQSSEFKFIVDSVETNPNLLADTSFEICFASVLEKMPFVYPKDELQREMIPVRNNGFASAVEKAYTYHYPLVISPDDIWLLICQGFAHHVNHDPKKYEDLLLKKDHPKVLSVWNDSLPSLAASDWKNLIHSFTKQADKFLVGKTNAFFAKQFSTTTPMITTVYEATLMETLKSYFAYYGGSGCGIPYVKIKGTTQDWKTIYASLDQLKAYGMGFWVTELKPIIKEFIRCSEGKPNPVFWKSIFKDMHEYGATYISGWVLKFYPYLKKGEISQETDSGYVLTPTYKVNPFLKGNDYVYSDLGIDDLPSGYTKTKVVWENFFKTPVERKNLELNAGFLGLYQDPTTKEISTCITWAFSDDDAAAVYPEFYAYNEQPMHKNGLAFSPEITKTPQIKPIYHPERNKDYDAGIAEFKSYVVKAIANDANYKALKTEIKVKMVVTWMGTLERVKVECANAALATRIKQMVEKCPYSWKPGKFQSRKFDIEHRDVIANVELTVQIK